VLRVTMRRVLLLATTTGYQTRAFDEAAERLGVDLVLATDRCNVLEDPWQDAAMAIRFHHETASIEAIARAAIEKPIDGVLAVGDRPSLIAAATCEALNLPWHPVAGVTVARSKVRTRERLREAGLLSPWFRSIDLAGDPRSLLPVDFPCVLKPVALTGSRGVMRADDEPSLVAAFNRLRSIMKAPDIRGERTTLHETAVVEGFIPGREFAIEGLMTAGRLRVLAIFDKPDPLNGPFFEETIYVTPSSEPACIQRPIAESVARAAKAIGLRHGPIHAECRVNDAGVFVLEVAPRPIGGLCARVLRFVEEEAGLKARTTPEVVRTFRSAISFEELLLRHAIGQNVTRYQREPGASAVMMIPIPRRGILRSVAGLDHARAVPGIDDVRITAKPDQVLVPLPEGASYLGFIFARAEGPSAAVAALRAAHKRLVLNIEPELRMVQSVHG
jgi:biotin carboxylase